VTQPASGLTLPDGTARPDLTHLHSGKVRDLYRTEDGRLVMVASDRISAFDFILDTPIPDKGAILTALSVWWFEQLADVVANHVISTDDPVIPVQWRGRALLCQSLNMVPVEAVVRGYLTGSGLSDYRRTGAVCGVELPAGLVDASRLAEPIFTPASKADLGSHDENVSYADIVASEGESTAARLRQLSLAVYARAADIARERGIIIADTKFEFGFDATGRLILGDEVLTPDSSRFWPAQLWQPGHPQSSFDKQYVRDWLTSPESGWDRASELPPPPLPDEVVTATRQRYVAAYEQLTGLRFADWPQAGGTQAQE
jgi:phosphoribosylaminoimidazole-succinocarboxamide synthase